MGKKYGKGKKRDVIIKTTAKTQVVGGPRMKEQSLLYHFEFLILLCQID